MSDRSAYYGSSYDRYAECTDDSTTHKLKNAFWTTKQVVIKKFGRKEDEHVVASDCELDAKLELFRSIQKTCMDLTRIIDRYQDRICVLSQAENELGRFLKNHGGEDKTRAGKMMIAVGKSLSFSAQQRLALRVPLARLQQEVETFRYRAISDTLETVMKMEQKRTDYRAALLWMRDVSENLDPDTYKQLDKFRKVQAQVRKTKGQFDKIKLDSMQKVDLLAASRCNMFSHVLSLYQSTLLQFWEKTCRTMVAVADSFKGYQYYEFSMLKDLTDESRKLAELTRGPNKKDEVDLLGGDESGEERSDDKYVEDPSELLKRNSCDNISNSQTADSDTNILLTEETKSNKVADEFDDLNKRLDEIFTADYKDDPESDIKAAIENNKMTASKKEIQSPNESKQNFNSDVLGLGLSEIEEQEKDRAFLDDLIAGDNSNSIFDDFIGQQQADGQQSHKSDWGFLFGSDNPENTSSLSSNQTTVASNMLASLMPSALLDTRSQLGGINIPHMPLSGPNSNAAIKGVTGNMKAKPEKKDSNAAWLSMFADLDPLANPDTISKKEGQITDT